MVVGEALKDIYQSCLSDLCVTPSFVFWPKDVSEGSVVLVLVPLDPGDEVRLMAVMVVPASKAVQLPAELDVPC